MCRTTRALPHTPEFAALVLPAESPELVAGSCLWAAFQGREPPANCLPPVSHRKSPDSLVPAGSPNAINFGGLGAEPPRDSPRFLDEIPFSVFFCNDIASGGE